MADPTPRKLKVTIELDVTEGPRIRRGTRERELQEGLLKPLIEYAEELAGRNFGLTSRDSSGKAEWGYTWLSADVTTKQPLNGAEQQLLIQRLAQMPPGSIILTMTDLEGKKIGEDEILPE